MPAISTMGSRLRMGSSQHKVLQRPIKRRKSQRTSIRKKGKKRKGKTLLPPEASVGTSFDCFADFPVDSLLRSIIGLGKVRLGREAKKPKGIKRPCLVLGKKRKRKKVKKLKRLLRSVSESVAPGFPPSVSWQQQSEASSGDTYILLDGRWVSEPSIKNTAGNMIDMEETTAAFSEIEGEEEEEGEEGGGGGGVGEVLSSARAALDVLFLPPPYAIMP